MAVTPSTLVDGVASDGQVGSVQPDQSDVSAVQSCDEGRRRPGDHRPASGAPAVRSRSGGWHSERAADRDHTTARPRPCGGQGQVRRADSPNNG